MEQPQPMKTNPTERRRYARMPLGVRVRAHFEGSHVPLAVELRDISFGGCYFTARQAPPSTTFAFGFRLPDQQVCVAAGRVLRVDRNGFAATISRTSDTFAEFMDQLSGPVVAPQP